MKIKVDVDASPEELRTFFGLPDIKPLQDEMLEQVRTRMREGAEGYDPLTLLRPFLPAGSLQGMEALQQRFWDTVSGGGASPRKDAPEPDKRRP